MSWTASDPNATTGIELASQLVGNDSGFLLSNQHPGEVGSEVWFSPDGLSWSALDNSTFGAAKWVTLAADQSGFWVSAEGELNPVPATPTAPNASAGLFGNGNDRLYHSLDGRSWTPIVEGPDAPRDIGAAGGYLFASTPDMGGTAKVMRSTDGVNWEPTTFPAAGNFHPRAPGVREAYGRFLFPAVHDYDGGLDYFESADGLSWRLLPPQPGSGTNAITPRGIVRASVPYPPVCSPPGDPCLQDGRIATLDWSASAWKTGDVVGATLAQAPVLRAVGDELVLVLVDDSGLVTLTRSNDTAAWTTAADATLAIGHAVDVSAATNTTSIVIVVHDTVASFLVGRCITQSCRR